MTFTEDWFADDACKVLAEFAEEILPLEGRIMEIGCWEGKSTVALANAVEPCIVHAVDTWEGSAGEISEILAKTRDVEAQFRHNVRELTEGNVLAYRMDWRDYLADHPYPIRFCHIDGLHTYEEVSAQLEAIEPLLVPGAVVCGDDIHDEGVCRAVLERWPDAYRKGPLWRHQVPKTMLEAEYRKAAHTPSDIYEHLPVFVRMCDELSATKVIELGTRGGVSTIAWLYGLQHVGHLWSVDIDPAPSMEYDHWTFVHGDDCAPDIVDQLPDNADVVFIDTSHAYEHTVSELNIYRWKVRPGGRIVLHDTEVRKPVGTVNQPPFPVKRAVEQFCSDEGLRWLNLPNCNGLGIIDIP